MTKTTPETKVYSHEQAIKDSLEYFNGDELAANVFVTKYAVRNLKGELIENTPVAMHRRMAKEFARIEKTYSHSADFRYSEYGQKRSFLTEEKIFSYFDKFKYIVPQGSPMSVLGNPFAIASLSNCIVIPELFDSYGGICFADQQLAILMKRRCVEENSFVDTKEKGIVPIKEIKIGMHVLSYDISKQTTTYKKVLNRFETEVETDNRIKLTLSNGSVLKTSKKHPILVRRGTEYMYINGGELQINDICVKPEFRHSLSNNFSINDQDLTDIGWLLGVHMGDGSCIDYKKTQQYNFRISGDNENVVKEYARVFNAFTNKKNIYKVSTRKDYSVPVWEYYATLSHEKGKVFLDKYLDNQYGKKTYTGKTPSFIKENNLWIPYIAGLIDADGAIREKGSAVCLALCTKTIIDEIATFLTSHGISCKVSTYVPKKSNEQIRYQLYIHSSRLFWNILSPYLRHEVKRTKLENHSVREYSQRLPITSQELQEFERRYQDTPKKPNDLAAVMYLSRKNGIMGKASLNQLVTKDILSEKEQQSILQRVQIVNIETDTESTKYIDIEVEHTNNFYAGNNGMICIHNCGVGVDISELRPSGASVTNAGATSSGAISFMERFSSTTREVAQNGRRGALMITIDIAHPDVEAFVLSKQDLTKVTGANISIRLSDEFMKAVRDDKEYTHRWPIESKTPKYTKTVNARKLWEVIIKAAHNTAEPGLIFWDRQHKYSTSSVYPGFKNTSTNPCSEIAMQGGDSCRLIALNLFGCVDNPFTPQAKFNFEKFYEVTYEAQRLMDDLVELEIEAIQRILDKVNSDDEPDYIKDTEVRTWKLLLETGKKGRRTGLGFTAFADALAALGFGYDSEEGLKATEEIMKTKLRAEFDSSIDMAIERGAFEGFNTRYENDSDFIQMLKEEFPEIAGRMMVYGRRNISISTVAPTGSLSIIAQSSSGMEPVFMLSYKRRKKIMTSNVDVKVDFVDSLGDKWQEFDVYHTKLKMWMDVTGETDITKSPYFGSTAPEIDWIKRVEIQALIQKYITHSISSTINLPNDVSLEKVSEIYMESWKQGLKGITVYRDGSRSGVLVSKDEKKKEEYKETHAPKRPEALDCDIIRFVNDREKWIGFVGLLGEAPYEVFTGKADEITIPLSVTRGKMVRVKKGDISSYNFHYIQGEKEIVVEQINRAFDKHYWNYAKLISGVLRHGMPLPFVVDTIASLNLEDALITTWKNGVGRMIKRYIKDGTVAGDKKCKDCGAESVIYQEGCLVCNSCGSSKCG